MNHLTMRWLSGNSLKGEPVVDRIESRTVLVKGDCWLYLGSTTHGYGTIGLNGKSARAHRVMYEAKRGPVPPGLQLDHLCRRRNCVNPDHLEPVDNRTNVLRGVGHTAVNAKKDHCKRGHPLEGSNLVRLQRGWRGCRICLNARTRDCTVRRAGRRISERKERASWWRLPGSSRWHACVHSPRHDAFSLEPDIYTMVSLCDDLEFQSDRTVLVPWWRDGEPAIRCKRCVREGA